MSETEELPVPPVGGGLKAVRYVMSIANTVGTLKLASAVRSRNTCKACAFGTGGQRGGLHNEYGKGVEICNKNIQAQSGDIRPGIPAAIFTDNSIEELQQLSGKQLEDLGRLQHPLYKGPNDTHYRIISYAEAIERISQQLRATQAERSFFYSSGRSSNEAAFILQLFARLYGSNHVNNCSYYCHQASGVGLQASIGTGTATIGYHDLHLADTIFVMGANPASNHPRFVKTLIECRRRGGQVIVVNPAREAGLLRFASPSNFRSMIAGGAEIASHYVQPHIGGDLAFMNAVARHLIERGGVDHAYVDAHCRHFDDYRAAIEAMSWSQLCEESGVSEDEIRAVADVYQRSRATVFAWGMGLTHHQHGVENIEAVSNLALLRGMIGGPGKGLLPLRGHSNVQGVGSMGVTPVLKKQIFDSLERELGVSLPSYEGMDTLACLRAAEAGDIDLAFLLGGNLYAASPDSNFARRALDAIPFKVMLSSTMNLGHVQGVAQTSIVLPVRVRDEETQPTTQESMFNYVRLSDGGFDRIEELRSEVDIISSIACEVIDRDRLDFRHFSQHRSIREAIARVIPGYQAMQDMDDSRQEFHIDGRILETPRFPTPDGKASFSIPRQAIAEQSQHPYRLTTVRSEGQFNTIVYTDNDVYRNQTSRDVLLMNPADMAREGLLTDSLVDVYNATGELTQLKVKPYPIRAGNLMSYFPEANVLVPQHADPRSHTPAFKSVAVFLRKKAAAVEAG